MSNGNSGFVSDWRAAEENAAQWMRRWGYTDASTTGSGPDRGLDVVSSRAVAQVKFEAQPTGRPKLQNLVGAAAPLGERRLVFFTASSYTRDAEEYADIMGILLFIFDQHGNVSAHNSAARSQTSTALRPRLITTSVEVDDPNETSRWDLDWAASLPWLALAVLTTAASIVAFIFTWTADTPQPVAGNFTLFSACVAVILWGVFHSQATYGEVLSSVFYIVFKLFLAGVFGLFLYMIISVFAAVVVNSDDFSDSLFAEATIPTISFTVGTFTSFYFFRSKDLFGR